MAIQGLKRVLGLPEVAFIAIGTTVGGGVFVLTGIVLKIAGPALPLSYGLAVVPVFISMLPLAMLGSALPATGGNYRYPSRMLSPGLAFTGVWVYVLASFIGQIPLYAIACARYLQVFFPGLSTDVFAMGLITFFFVINVLGIRLAVQVQGVMVVVMIAALVSYAARGAVIINPDNFNDFFQMGPGGIILGTALLTFTYFGSNAIIELGGEIKTPGKVIPRAFVISFAVVAVIYIVMAVATVGMASWKDLAACREPLVEGSAICFGRGGAGFTFFIVGGAILAVTTTLNGLFIIGTKSLQVIVHDGILPAFLGKVHARFGSAYILLTIIWVLSIAGLLSGFSLETFANYAALGGMIIFVPVLASSMMLPRRYPERYRDSLFKLKGFWLYFCPIVGFGMVAFFSAVILAEMKSPLQIALFFVFILSGILYYLIRKRWLLSRGKRLDDVMKQEDWIS
jgi:basic amino acid/polyamine antiporter, APA family